MGFVIGIEAIGKTKSGSDSSHYSYSCLFVCLFVCLFRFFPSLLQWVCLTYRDGTLHLHHALLVDPLRLLLLPHRPLLLPQKRLLVLGRTAGAY